MCEEVGQNRSETWRSIYNSEYGLDIAGKLMAYSAISKPNASTIDLVSAVMRSISVDHEPTEVAAIPDELILFACQSEVNQRSIAAAIQIDFNRFMLNMTDHLFALVGGRKTVDGIVFTGGCALNVILNQLVRETFKVEVYVPPAPSDAGLVVGGLWSVAPPKVHHPLEYLGFRLWDEEILEMEARARGARSLNALGGISYLAELLVGGKAFSKDEANRTDLQPIIAIVREGKSLARALLVTDRSLQSLQMVLCVSG